MLVVRTSEDSTDPVGKRVSAKQAVGLDHLPLAVNPFRLYRVQPWALHEQQAAYNPHSSTTLFDLAVVPADPAPHLATYVPACVVPDEEQKLLADSFELLSAPSEKPGRYPAHGPTIHVPQPRLFKLRQVEAVAGDGLGLGIVFGDRLLEQTQRLSLFGPATQGGQSQPTPPALVLKTHCPLGVGRSHLHQSVAPSFFFRTKDRGR